MQLIKPSIELIPQEISIVGINKMIELAARLAYKSEDKITEDSYGKFINMLEEKKHYSPFEFGTVYLLLVIGSPNIDKNYTNHTDIVLLYKRNPYSIVKENYDGHYKTYYITTNMRVVIENDRYDDLRFLAYTPNHEKRVTIRVISSIGIMREWMRHRHFSYLQESTRYCNYTHKNKFNKGIAFVIPSNMEIQEVDYLDLLDFQTYCENNKDILKEHDICFIKMLLETEQNYNYLINYMSPQYARNILPLVTKAETLVCGFERDWKYLIELRSSAAAHPDFRYLANLLKEYFV